MVNYHFYIILCEISLQYIGYCNRGLMNFVIKYNISKTG